MKQIECTDLTLGYGGTTVVEHLSFSIEEGDYLCIIGENGSGKTTLMKTLLDLNKPQKGKVHRTIRPKEIGYLPQQSAVQRDFPATVREIVLSGCLGSKRFFSFYTASDRAKAADAMEKLGVADRASDSFKDLSGGLKQRVLLARALCASKKMLLLDEPVAGLDAASTETLGALIADLNRRHGVTIVMITHRSPEELPDATHFLRLSAAPLFGTREVFLSRQEGGEAHD